MDPPPAKFMSCNVDVGLRQFQPMTLARTRDPLEHGMDALASREDALNWLDPHREYVWEETPPSDGRLLAIRSSVQAWVGLRGGCCTDARNYVPRAQS